MTAPPIQEQEDFSAMDPMDAVLGATMKDSADLMGTEEEQGQARDQHGKFVKQIGESERKPEGTGEWNTLPDAPVEGEEPAESAAVVIPDGYVEPKLLPPERQQGFSVFDADGEIAAPDLTFKVNFRNEKGELEPVDLPIDKLVNYARMGRYNHEKEQQVTQTQQRNYQLEQRVQQVEQYAQQRDAAIEKLLSDPQHLIDELQRYERQNTPEGRLQRMEQERVTERERAEVQQVYQQGEQFLQSSILPALQTMEQALPNVSAEELAAKLLLLVEPFKVRTAHGTVIAPAHYQAIQNTVLREILPWAQQVNEFRESRNAPPKEKVKDAPDAKQEVAKAQQSAQKARRLAVTALKPVGGNGTPQGKSQPPVIKTSKDIEDAVVGRALRSMQAG